MGSGGIGRSAAGVRAGVAAWLGDGRLVPIVVASALFMELMDSSALALALPTIARHFAVPVIDLKFALTAYFVTVAVLVPTSGWLASRFGPRRVFLTAMMVFMAGSACCGMAANVPQLVGARILQGIGGSMMTPVGRLIMVSSVPRHKLVQAMAWYTLPAIMAPLIGPPLAGFLIEYANWRWIFFINLPVGLIGLVAVVRLVPVVAGTRRAGFDVPGFLLGAASILAIMAVFETGALAGRPPVWRVAAVAGMAALVWVYVRQALAAADPIADLRVVRHLTLRASLLATWLHRVALGGFTLLLPLQLQVALGYSPLASSQVMIAGATGSVLSRFLSPRGIQLFGFRRLTIGLSAVVALFTAVPGSFSHATPIALMAGFMLTYAASRASFFMAANTLFYCDVHGAEIGHATVLSAVAQQLSLGLGFSLAAQILEAMGGVSAPGAFTWTFAAVAILPLLGTLAVFGLPAEAGDTMRRREPA